MLLLSIGEMYIFYKRLHGFEIQKSKEKNSSPIKYWNRHELISLNQKKKKKKEIHP